MPDYARCWPTAMLDGSRPLSASDIAFRVAPRLNAAGRMDIAERVIQLFTEKDAGQSRRDGHAAERAERQPPAGRAAHSGGDPADDRIDTGDEGCVLPGGGRRQLASRRHRNLRHPHRGTLLPADADLLSRRRRGARLRPVDQRVSFTGGAGVVSGAVYPLRRPLPRCGMCAARRPYSGVAFAPGCLRSRSG